MKKSTQHSPQSEATRFLKEQSDPHLQSYEQFTLISNNISPTKYKDTLKTHKESILAPSRKKKIAFVVALGCLVYVVVLFWLYKMHETSNFESIKNYISGQYVSEVKIKREVRIITQVNDVPIVNRYQQSHQISTTQATTSTLATPTTTQASTPATIPSQTTDPTQTTQHIESPDQNNGDQNHGEEDSSKQDQKAKPQAEQNAEQENNIQQEQKTKKEQKVKETQKINNDQKLNQQNNKPQSAPKPKSNKNEEDSQRYMEYSKASQRKADRARRDKRIKKGLQQQNNILKDIKKNPYLDDEYSYLTKADLDRVKKWRYIVGQDTSTLSSLAEEEKAYFVKKYNIDKYPQLPFCIVIPTFNNKPRKRAERNTRSILMQDYTNFHFIVIDDGSVDGTGVLIRDYLATQTIVNSSRYRVEINTERHYAVPNIRRAAKTFCKPQDIMIVVDGDDELLGRQVLKLFNAVFQEKKVWFMYTNFFGSISKVGYSRPYHPEIIEKNQYRDYSFAVSHLRAYYTKLLLNIKDQDLQDQNGKFFTSAGDMAITIPCLQQAHKRVIYVPEMTYYYNFNTGLNVHRNRLNEQRANNLKIRSKKKYEPLEALF